MLFPSTPISYAIELTFACVNRCPGCANTWNSNRNKSLQNWKGLLDRIAPSFDRNKYAELIRITGGEPTLHKEFQQLIQYIDTFGIPHALFTSARWKSPDELIDLYRNCQNFVGMLISLHGSTPAAHRAFIGNIDGAFEETCNNIRKATSAGLNIFTNTVLTKFSCEQIEDIISLSQKLGAGHAVFNRFLGPDNPLQPSEDQLRNAVILIDKLQEQGAPCRIGNCIPQCFVRNSSEGTNAGIEHCAISPEGWVRPDNLTSYTFGNIFEQSIEEIWQSEKANHYRHQIPEQCHECVELPRCRGGEKSVSIEHGFGKDRLMKEPIRNAEPEPIVLDPDFRPVPHFRVRKEFFGYLVTRYNWSVPVTEEAKPVLDAINGQHTLLEIQEKFGNEALELIGHLYQQGCVGFE